VRGASLYINKQATAEYAMQKIMHNPPKISMGILSCIKKKQTRYVADMISLYVPPFISVPALYG